MKRLIFLATKGIKRKEWTRASLKCQFYNVKEKRCECLLKNNSINKQKYGENQPPKKL